MTAFPIHRRMTLALLFVGICLSGILFASLASAYLFGPGKYSGVVVVDHWGTCYLLSGPYVNYVAADVKSALLPYKGRAMQVDASEVGAAGSSMMSDPMLRKFKIVGPAPAPKRNQLKGLSLVAVQKFDQSSKPQFAIDFRNTGNDPVKVNRDEIGILVFAPEKPGHNTSYDGSSALISRNGIEDSSHIWSSQTGNIKTSWGYTVDPKTRPPSIFTIAPGQTVRTLIRLKLGTGQYEFMFAYGGAVSSEESLASNAIDFDVSGDGHARIVN